MTQDHSTRLVRIAEAGNELEGRMLADQLEQQGIRVLLQAGGPGAGAWASVATFAHTISVLEPDVDRALAILNNDRAQARARTAPPVVHPRRVR